MSFTFNFAVDDGNAIDQGPPTAAYCAAAAVNHTRRGERFRWSGAAEELAFTPVAIPMPDAPLHYEIVNVSDPRFIARTGAIGSILTTSDLEAGVYEGGFKLWECAVDLVRYMATTPAFQRLEHRRVVELGCGHGLPGIYALQRGAAHVTFMDYNKEVLELTTCPNVARNLHGDLGAYDRASFYAGAWSSVATHMAETEQLPETERRYDLILTAETIYTEAVAIELHQALKEHLSRTPGAVALVAAKKYYFGTGGSVQHFVGLVEADGALRSSVVWEESDGRSNMRAIVQVTRTA